MQSASRKSDDQEVTVIKDLHQKRQPRPFHVRPDAIRLSLWNKRLLYSGTALLFGSGVLWLVLHYFGYTQGEFGNAPHPLEPLFLKLHGAAAMIFLMLLGSLLRVHIPRGWTSEKNRVLGTVLGAFNLLLIVSAYALYYLANEETRPWISATHWILGLALPLLLVVHIIVGRRRN